MARTPATRRPPPPLRQWVVALGRAGCLVWAGAAFAAAAPALPPLPGPPPGLAAIEQSALDDPRAALALGAQRLAASQAAGDRASEFWLRIGLAGVHVQADNEAAAARELGAAAGLVPPGPQGQRERLWHEVASALAAASPGDLLAFREQQSGRRGAARSLGDEALLCRIAIVDAVVYTEQSAPDEAWAALEAVEACGRQLGDAAAQAYALGTMGLLAVRVNRQPLPLVYFERALAVLAALPSRFQRAWLLDDLGWAQLHLGDLVPARQAFEQSLKLSRELQDVSGTMRGHEGLAEVLLKQGEPARALPHAGESLRLATTEGLVMRRVTAQKQVVQAMTALRAPGLAREVQALRALATLEATPRAGVLIASTAARGLRALGQHAAAYAELERYVELMRGDEKARRDSLAQQLQARYEAVRRDAELSELRHRAEATRLELEARTERQRALWAVVLALLLALAGVAWFSARALRRRRSLADLALRDELTGLPNRRAVLAFAHAQFGVARQLRLPLSIALIDLDRFKQVNDNYGHICGDRVLQAFGAAASGALRGHDRIGRYGGEEWLVVMPGTGADELVPLFERLRARLAALRIEGLPHPHGVSFSMGGAQLGPGTDNVEALIADADAQLYRAKAHGRDAMCSAPDVIVRMTLAAAA